jgi:hypothetical protein
VEWLENHFTRGVADDELAVSEQLFSLAMSAPPKTNWNCKRYT